MAYCGKLIVPTEPEGSRDVINDIERMASATMGGYSEYEGTGGWRNADAEIIEEDHVMIVIDCTEDYDMTHEQFVNFMKNHAEHVKRNLGEECVMFKVEEPDIHFI